MHWRRWVVVVLAAGLASVPRVNRTLARGLERIRFPSARAAEWAGVLIGAGAACYLVATAFEQGRDLFPKTEDECSYLISAQLLARGRLWMPMHPLADFFDSFYVLVRPVYCSIYFPGAAIWFVPAVWLSWPSWIVPVVMSGAAVGLLYRIVTELVDGVAGAIAAVWMLGLGWFRMISIMPMSHVPMLLLGLLMIWSWVRWRRRRHWGWALALGVFGGWAAITRPADALAFALPIGIAIGFEMSLLRVLRAFAVIFSGCGSQRPDPDADKPRRREGREENAREILPADEVSGYTRVAATGRTTLLTAAILALGAAPFLGVQIVFDIGVTGHALKTPYTLYLQQDQPGSEYGVHRFDPSRTISSALPQKQAYYEWCKTFLHMHEPGNFLRPWISAQGGPRRARPAYLLMLVDSTLPTRCLLLLLPIGLLGLRSSARAIVVAAILPAFIVIYLFNPFFLEHYAVIAAPAMIVLVLLGARALASAWPGASTRLGTVLSVIVFTLALTSFWEIHRWMPSRDAPTSDETFTSRLLFQVNEGLADEVEQPAVVLFRFTPGDNFFEEPVYNPSAAWPDDAPIIRAHDLGTRNREIIEYYARRQPGRTFYLFDPHDRRSPIRLGKAAELRG